LTLPSSWTVGATGRLANSQVQGNGTTTRRYEAEGVTDFAWIASPAFVERLEQVSAGTTATTVRLLMQREHSSQSDRHLAAAKAALASYIGWFGRPPPESITTADT
jgi:hypothetical protein